MENRKPFHLQNTLIVYNFIQVIFSAWLFYEVSLTTPPHRLFFYYPQNNMSSNFTFKLSFFPQQYTNSYQKKGFNLYAKKKKNTILVGCSIFKKKKKYLKIRNSNVWVGCGCEAEKMPIQKRLIHLFTVPKQIVPNGRLVGRIQFQMPAGGLHQKCNSYESKCSEKKT